MRSLRTLTSNWSRLPHILSTVAAAAPHPSLQSSAGLQLAQLAANGTAAEKALLADVTATTPDDSYIERLRLFKARIRCDGARFLLRVSRPHLLTAAAPEPDLAAHIFTGLRIATQLGFRLSKVGLRLTFSKSPLRRG